MRGMNAATGKAIDGAAHLRQSIADILSTPIGTRVARRDYGSLLFELIDQPMAGAGRLRLYAAVAIALMRWETRLKLTRVGIERGEGAGAYTITVEGRRTDVAGPNSLTLLTIPLRAGFSASN